MKCPVCDAESPGNACPHCGRFCRTDNPRRALPGNTSRHNHNPAAHHWPNTRKDAAGYESDDEIVSENAVITDKIRKKVSRWLSARSGKTL